MMNGFSLKFFYLILYARIHFPCLIIHLNYLSMVKLNKNIYISYHLESRIKKSLLHVQLFSFKLIILLRVNNENRKNDV